LPDWRGNLNASTGVQHPSRCSGKAHSVKEGPDLYPQAHGNFGRATGRALADGPRLQGTQEFREILVQSV